MINDKIHISEIPDLMREWDGDKNEEIGLYPDKMLLGSNKKAWWRCRNGHEYLEQICQKTKGKPCPYCANKRVLMGYNDLKTCYPDIAREWDYNKNKSVDINDVVCGSNKKVWWKCSSCGHEWVAKVQQRTVRKSGCPQCAIHKRSAKRGKTLLKNKGGITSSLLLKEWDYVANQDLLPSHVTNGSGKSVYWKCSVCGFRWQAKVCNRAISGRGCPYCANRVVMAGRNDLATTHPNLAQEWDYANNNITPQQVTYGSGIKVNWICPLGHRYQATVLHRTSGTNCPICNSGKQTSFAEQAFLFYIKRFHPDAINRYTSIFDNGMELDIYIPSLKIAIEYDGIFWHRNNRKREEMKYQICRKNGIKLVRIKESADIRCEGIADRIYHADNLDNKRILNGLIINVILDLEMWTMPRVMPYLDVNVFRDEFEIRKYMTELKSGSLKELRPDLVQEWNYEKNGHLLPSMFSLGSDQKVWWKCSVCGNIWRASIGHRVNGTGCSVCYRRNNNGANHSGAKRVYQYSNDGYFLKEWDCIAHAGEELKINHSNISMCAQGQREKAGGFRWEFFYKDKLETKIKPKKSKKGLYGKTILQIDDNGSVINEFVSLNEASRQLKINATSISKALNGHIKRAGGYFWKEK